MNTKKYGILTVILLSCFSFLSVANSQDVSFQNSAEILLGKENKLNIGGYGEVHYNQPFGNNKQELGQVDVHRMVLFLGYNFSSNTQFVTEIEYEYANELWIEQLFLQQKINPSISFRAGLLLIPMGIINEYHEPTTFHGVERPLIDNKIAPSTWREIGFGLTGNILPINLKYQAYLVNGLNGYDTKGVFSGTNALRQGRQKGSKAYVNSPAFAGKIEYYGARNLSLGLSTYQGVSQSKLYNNLSANDTETLLKADSSVVGISMFGADARYQKNGFELRGQLYYTQLSNTKQYNEFTGTTGSNNDLGKALIGYYVEAGYNVFKPFNSLKTELIPFVRYEYFDTHHAIDEITTKNLGYQQTIITAGVTYKLTPNAALKTDVQFTKSAMSSTYNKVFNVGIGFMF
ncbi:MAG: hypothetical protein GX273_07110 [Bacteroidales bacterium]|nr:hypothetical protein [Bacteroidales bacterium]